MKRAVLPLVALALTGAATGLALTRSAPNPEGFHERNHHAGPDSARVEAFLSGLQAAAPMLCEMLADQVGNFWNSSGEFGVGLLADGSRSWESARDSLYSPPTDAAALRRISRAFDDPNPCVRRAAAKLLGHGQVSAIYAVIREGLKSPSARVREAAALAAGRTDGPELTDDLVRATRDANVLVVAMATWGLGALERRESVDRLNELGRHEDLRGR